MINIVKRGDEMSADSSDMCMCQPNLIPNGKALICALLRKIEHSVRAQSEGNLFSGAVFAAGDGIHRLNAHGF